MKPLIGIIEKEGLSSTKKKITYTYKEILGKIINSNGIPIGIVPQQINETLNIIDGIILQGGDDYIKEEIELVKYAYKNDIPLLGICLGMQTIGIAMNGTIKKVYNHMKPNIKNVHDVYIKKDSKIYEILNKEKITVNSRHNYALIKTSLDITGYSTDNIIEVIEDKTKKFFIGLQWHPESLEDENSKKIFDYFIKKASEK